MNLASDPLPLYVTGTLTTARREPLTIAVAVNGAVAAVTQSYRDRDAHVFGTLIPEASLHDGNNSVAAFVVEEIASAGSEKQDPANVRGDPAGK